LSPRRRAAGIICLTRPGVCADDFPDKSGPTDSCEPVGWRSRFANDLCQLKVGFTHARSSTLGPYSKNKRGNYHDCPSEWHSRH